MSLPGGRNIGYFMGPFSLDIRFLFSSSSVIGVALRRRTDLFPRVRVHMIGIRFPMSASTQRKSVGQTVSQPHRRVNAFITRKSMWWICLGPEEKVGAHLPACHVSCRQLRIYL